MMLMLKKPEDCWWGFFILMGMNMGITRDSLRFFQWLLGMKMGLPPPPVLRSSPVLRREVVWQTLAARGFHGTRSGTSTNGAEGHVSLWVHLDLINIYIYISWGFHVDLWGCSLVFSLNHTHAFNKLKTCTSSSSPWGCCKHIVLQGCTSVDKAQRRIMMNLGKL
jgi:hypothetical protein